MKLCWESKGMVSVNPEAQDSRVVTLDGNNTVTCMAAGVWYDVSDCVAFAACHVDNQVFEGVQTLNKNIFVSTGQTAGYSIAV
mmetsp:Transcript_80704/g.184962  ORF Transcript_80704/g.184962 Transcript_80704/m.184962 type:complete len:83 (-) Transcript_80704:46-294(-)